jgi:hypothetical protein
VVLLQLQLLLLQLKLIVLQLLLQQRLCGWLLPGELLQLELLLPQRQLAFEPKLVPLKPLELLVERRGPELLVDRRQPFCTDRQVHLSLLPLELLVERRGPELLVERRRRPCTDRQGEHEQAREPNLSDHDVSPMLCFRFSRSLETERACRGRWRLCAGGRAVARQRR